MHTLLIGGGGFIGAWLADMLAASGRAVTVLGRRDTSSKALHPSIHYVSGSFDDLGLLRDLLSRHDEVVDLAYSTVPNTSFEAPLQDLLQNLPAVVNLFTEALAAKVRRVLVVSSGGTVYGEAKYIPITEDHPTHPLSPYGITKLTIEHYARWFYAVHGLPVMCVRPANAYGEGQTPFRGQGFVATAIASIIEGRPLTIFGESGTVRDYIHVSDVATAILDVLNHGHPGEAYNVGTGVGLNNLDVVDAIDRLAAAQSMQSRIIRAAARPFDVQRNVLDSAQLTRLAGWSPRITFEDGLERTWRWHFDAYRK